MHGLLFASGWGSRPRDEELTPIEDDDTPFEEEEDRSSVSLGWVYHALMSAKARLGWLMSAAYRSLVSSSPPPRRASFERQEPSLRGRAAPTLAPQDEEFEEEEDEEEEGGGGSSGRPLFAQEGRAARTGPQIRKIRTAFGLEC